MSEGDIAGMRKETAQKHLEIMGEAVAALAAKSDEELQADKMPKSSIKLLREAAERLQSEGLGGLRALRGGSGEKEKDGQDLDLLLADWAVPHIKGDKTHLGTLFTSGKKALADLVARLARPETPLVLLAIIGLGFGLRFARRRLAARAVKIEPPPLPAQWFGKLAELLAAYGIVAAIHGALQASGHAEEIEWFRVGPRGEEMDHAATPI